MRHRLRLLTGPLLAGALLAVLPPRPGLAAQAAPGPTPSADEEVALLRRELDALRQEYARRMAAIEEKLAAIEAARVAAGTPAAPTKLPIAAMSGLKAFEPVVGGAG